MAKETDMKSKKHKNHNQQSAQNSDDVFNSLKEYFETKAAPRIAISCLKPGVEIGVIISSQVDCAIINSGGLPVVEKRMAVNPDFLFHIEAETLQTLAQLSGDDVAEVGISVFKELLAGHLKVEFKSNIWSILSNGYLDMIKTGGKTFADHIAAFGFTNLLKLSAMIEKLKAQTKTTK